MRIVHVTDFYLPRLGGIELHVADLTERQRRAGHDVSVATSSPGPQDRHITRFGASAGPRHPLNPLGLRDGLRWLRDQDPDVLHAHVGVGSPLGFFLARAAARQGIPVVVTVHSMWTWVLPIMAALDRWGRWSRLPIVWTTVSEAAAGPVRRLIPDSEVLVIPNGIDQERWRPETLPVHDAPPVVAAAVMRLSPRKRPIPLVRMVRDANAALGRGQAIRLVIAGNGPMGPVLRAYAAVRGMSRQVTFAGRLDRDGVAAVLAGADLFVAPARLESFGIAALEARCAGLPVVAMASGGVGEFVGHETEGLLCDTDADMTAALVRLARDEPLRRRMSQHNASSDCRIAWPSVLAETARAYRLAGDVQAGDPALRRTAS